MFPREAQTRPEEQAWPFESLYLAAREREGRRLDVPSIRRLPSRPENAADGDEWAQRAWSARWLVCHLRDIASHAATFEGPSGEGLHRDRVTRSLPSEIFVGGSDQRTLNILDLGCGYGWLSVLLSRELDAHVVGLDASGAELALAAEAFGDESRVRFLHGEVFNADLDAASFDAVVLAASFQYFEDVSLLLRHLRALLTPRGEILIVESPIWRERQVAAARRRTETYYSRLGLAPLAQAFHHRSRQELAPHVPRWYYLPDSFSARFRRNVLRQPVSSFPIVGFGARI